MRKLPLLLLALLLPAGAAHAQSGDAAPVGPAAAGVPVRGGAVPLPARADLSAPPAELGPGRDRMAGARRGLVAGALVGGLGFAALNYALSTGGSRGEYTVLSLGLGAAVGGAVGAILGAILGVPEPMSEPPAQVRLRTVPVAPRPR